MTNASSVSRTLREGGLRPLPSGTPAHREGLRVKRGLGYVVVAVSVDSAREQAALADDAHDILVRAGLDVRRTQPNILFVTERGE